MNEEALREIVGDYCDRSHCDGCILRCGGWKQEITIHHCIDIDAADLCDLLRAVEIINQGGEFADCEDNDLMLEYDLSDDDLVNLLLR